MSLTITHSTPADSSFSASGELAWEAEHTVTGQMFIQLTQAQYDALSPPVAGQLYIIIG